MFFWFFMKVILSHGKMFKHQENFKLKKANLPPSLHTSARSPTPTTYKKPPLSDLVWSLLKIRHLTSKLGSHISITTLFKIYRSDFLIDAILHLACISNNIFWRTLQNSTHSSISFYLMMAHFHKSKKWDSFSLVLGNHCLLHHAR